MNTQTSENETTDLLREILPLLKAIAATNPPNWQMPLKSYPKFDWSKVGATVVASDQVGATAVRWCGHVYTRRAGENKKFGAAIWFSRGAGKDVNGEACYVRLITFRVAEMKPEPLPDYVLRSLR